ncbi:uncharacterized protein BX663DRAFT_501340 [Cokeromyces recurvatus]|uniref:uncharacterized protein n=1 Tax=Cokeromyces recurvatus TaxID=90255 RepID=UPI00221EC7D8|nr:uncharacterized protein BX663DRAFT_501340 [Cokeromyces recurvatus]KAI7905011.1 hypothetical protein BX663DRAFT_501340 [Cokeromyces recurvatus]
MTMRRSSSASSLTQQSVQLLDYNQHTSPNHNLISLTDIMPPSSPSLTYVTNQVDKVDDHLIMSTNNHLVSPLLQDQGQLRLQLFHMKQHFERMQNYFEKQMTCAQIQIEKQQIRIQQLEGALHYTTLAKHSSVKQSTTTNYTNNNNMYSYSFIAENHPTHLYELHSQMNQMTPSGIDENLHQHHHFHFQPKEEDNSQRIRSTISSLPPHLWSNTPHDYFPHQHSVTNHDRLVTAGSNDDNSKKNTTSPTKEDELNPVLLSSSTSTTSTSTVPINAPNTNIYSSSNHINFNSFM